MLLTFVHDPPLTRKDLVNPLPIPLALMNLNDLEIVPVIVELILLNPVAKSPTMLSTWLILNVLTTPLTVPRVWSPVPLTVALTFRAVLPVRAVKLVHRLQLLPPSPMSVPPKLLKAIPLFPTVLHRLPRPVPVLRTSPVNRPTRLGTVPMISCYVVVLIPPVDSTRPHRLTVPVRTMALPLLVRIVPPNVSVTSAVLLRPPANGVSRRITLTTSDAAAGRLLTSVSTCPTVVVVLPELHFKPPTIPGKPPTALVCPTVFLIPSATTPEIPSNVDRVNLSTVLNPVVFYVAKKCLELLIFSVVAAAMSDRTSWKEPTVPCVDVVVDVKNFDRPEASVPRPARVLRSRARALPRFPSVVPSRLLVDAMVLAPRSVPSSVLPSCVRVPTVREEDRLSPMMALRSPILVVRMCRLVSPRLLCVPVTRDAYRSIVRVVRPLVRRRSPIRLDSMLWLVVRPTVLENPPLVPCFVEAVVIAILSPSPALKVSRPGSILTYVVALVTRLFYRLAP